jgi:dihydroxy-acid dehydratase
VITNLGSTGDLPGRRSADWFGADDVNGFLHRSWIKNQGHPDRMFDGRPVIGIAQTFSDLTPCNGHFRELAEFVKRGVYEAGGFPVEFPVMSLGETIVRPTTMLYRNLAAMDVEESIRANPVDGVVLLCGCDKTTPSLLMGAASVDLPTIVLSGGPMLTGSFRGQPLGSGTDVFRMSEDVRAGRMSREEFREAESCMSRSAGHCNTMGTASTMASVVESLGMSLPHNAAIPAVDSRRRVLAHETGRRIVEMVAEDLRMSQVLTREAFENAITVNAAIAGSTNAIMHLLALAGRLEVPLALDDFDLIGSDVPALVDVKPSGRFLMEDFFEAGGLPGLMATISDRLHLDIATVAGSVRDRICAAPVWNRDVIRAVDDPVAAAPALAVLRGNLAPDGAVIKVSAASPELLDHRGPAVVVDSMEELYARFDDPDADIPVDAVLVLRNAGPRGYPGMPELGNLPLPKRLLEAGVRDMVRISDARMSGTAFGTVVLHVSPESAVGGPLALLRDGDPIHLDVANRKLHAELDDGEWERRRIAWAPPTLEERGYVGLYRRHVEQAHLGADFDFLRGSRGDEVRGDNH